ncbi:MAG: hypothetical protein JW822_09970 [Spirochaetales bacterium]|nr:hypothetical protein [Spirochaetales bacterium]
MQYKTVLILTITMALYSMSCGEPPQKETETQEKDVRYISRELSAEERTQLKEEIKKEVVEELLEELNRPATRQTKTEIKKLREIIEELKKQEDYEP